MSTLTPERLEALSLATDALGPGDWKLVRAVDDDIRVSLATGFVHLDSGGERDITDILNAAPALIAAARERDRFVLYKECLEVWQSRFEALRKAWDTGDNATALEAMRLFVSGRDSDLAAAAVREREALKAENEELKQKLHDALEELNDGLMPYHKKLKAENGRLERDAEMACNEPPPDCECPGCSTARQRNQGDRSQNPRDTPKPKWWDYEYCVEHVGSATQSNCKECQAPRDTSLAPASGLRRDWESEES